jgi:hypothetical protein
VRVGRRAKSGGERKDGAVCATAPKATTAYFFFAVFLAAFLAAFFAFFAIVPPKGPDSAEWQPPMVVLRVA